MNNELYHHILQFTAEFLVYRLISLYTVFGQEFLEEKLIQFYTIIASNIKYIQLRYNKI